MKKLSYRLAAALFAVVMMVTVLTSTAFGAETVKIPNRAYEIELSLTELNEGVTLAVIQDSSGNYSLINLADKALYRSDSRAAIQATFHVGVERSALSAASIHWNATGNQLTRVEANVFCKSTSILHPETYYNNAISGYIDLAGRYNSASGETGSFYLGADVKKVRVGWSSAYVTTVTQGRMSMASASQAVSVS